MFLNIFWLVVLLVLNIMGFYVLYLEIKDIVKIIKRKFKKDLTK